MEHLQVKLIGQKGQNGHTAAPSAINPNVEVMDRWERGKSTVFGLSVFYCCFVYFSSMFLFVSLLLLKFYFGGAGGDAARVKGGHGGTGK